MYKELVISIIIVVLIISLDIGTQKYTDNVINDTTNNLYELIGNIKAGELLDEEASKKVNDIYERWLEYHKKLAFYIEHDELEKVETNFVTGRSYIESKQYDLAVAELEKTMFVLNHIKDKYEFNFENIF